VEYDILRLLNYRSEMDKHKLPEPHSVCFLPKGREAFFLLVGSMKGNLFPGEQVDPLGARG
jgi:hypothetical protein